MFCIINPLIWPDLVRLIYYFLLSYSPPSHLSSALLSLLLACLVLENFLFIIFQAVLLLLPMSCVPCCGQKSASLIKSLEGTLEAEELKDRS